jgi:hypothetical protein
MNAGGSGAWCSRGKPRSNPKAHQTDLTRLGVKENVGLF